MSHRQRGASYVSFVWTIAFGLLMIASIGFAFLQGQTLTQVREELARKEKELSEKEAERVTFDTRYKEFSAVSGYTGDKTGGTPELATKAIEAAKAELKADTPANAKTVEDVLTAALVVMNRQKREIADRDHQITGLKSEVSQQNSALSSARTDLQSQIDQEKTRAKDQQNTDAAKIASLQQQLDDKEKAAKQSADRVTAITEQKDKDQAEWTKRNSLLEAKNSDLNTKLAFTRKPAQPKGSIISVSDYMPIGYIDLGEKQRVAVGMRFSVMNYDNAHKLVDKGMVEITKLEPGMSEVRLETKEKLNPIAKGDVLLNPLYDPSSARKAVLVGRFPLATGGRKGVEEKLKALGCSVVEKVDPTVDYLIIGTPELSNTGEPIDMESHPEVMASAKFGTIRYTLKELESFLRK